MDLKEEIRFKSVLIKMTEKYLDKHPNDDTFIDQLWRLENERDELRAKLFKEEAGTPKKSGKQPASRAKQPKTKALASPRTKAKKVKR